MVHGDTQAPCERSLVRGMQQQAMEHGVARDVVATPAHGSRAYNDSK